MRLCRWFVALTLLVVARPAYAEEVLPKPPEDATAAKSYAVLDQYCARCHQSGKVAGATPAGGLGNILDLDGLGRDPNLIQPGNPDGSKLYTTILMRIPAHEGDAATNTPGNAPVSIQGGAQPAGQAKPADMTAADLDALRTWIKGLPVPQSCTSGTLSLTEQDAADALLSLQGMAADAGKSQRFISLTNLKQDCASEGDLAVYREAIGRAINSLSWGLDPFALQPVNSVATLFRIDLASIGWTAARWDRMAASYPFKTTGDRATRMAIETSSLQPIIRGDWLVANALRAPLYYDLLGLPDRLPTLLSSLKINLSSDVASGKARRYGTKTSRVARGARLVQRHEFANGAAWLTFEYAPTAGRQDVFDAPGGPAEAGSPNRSGPKPDATLMHFALPSGFTAFYMANADGQRLNDIATSIVRDDNHSADRIASAVSCFGCHSAGVRGAEDQLRPRLAAETQLPKEQHDKLLALHPTPEALSALFQDDRATVVKAMRSANLTSGLTLHGLDPISALVRRYERGVARAEVAEILSIDIAGLAGLEANAKGATLDALQRLNHGLLPRRDLIGLLPSLYALRTATDSAAVTSPPIVNGTSKPETIDVILKSSKASYRSGDLLVVTARATSNCHMTIVNVDANGRATVIFPNDFEPNNAVEAGVDIRLPSDQAPYQFRLKDKGRETIIAVCTATQKTADGIVHDFEKQRFTELGDYRSFISRVFASDPDERKSAARASDPKPKARRRGRTEPQAAAKDDKTTEVRDVRDIQGRAAIQIEIN
jgi:cytochrome c553